MAQTALRGQVVDSENNKPIPDAAVVISGTGKFTSTGSGGGFSIAGLAPGTYLIITTANGYYPNEQTVQAGGGAITIPMRRDQTAVSGDIPTVTLEEAESQSDGAGEVANLLHASRDIFQTIAGFGWSTFRFRERGYDSEHFPLLLNGVAINDPETGIAFFGELGGLNDVLRNRESAIGLEACEFAFSEIGGATRLDTRASNQRKQIRASYALSNRAYTHRTMVTANTGLMPGGWAVSASAAYRWAQEGYFDGTSFEGYSYFLSVDKQFTPNHQLNLTVLGAPTRRGRIGDSFQEMYDLAGTNRYNGLWGFQDGKKRNSSVSHSHQPMALLRYDFTNNETSVTLAAYGQAGQRGDTRLDWFEANNPLPDFNRRLPSSFADPVAGNEWAEALRQNEALRQIDWNSLYYANRANIETVMNADGQPGNSVTGLRSQYVVADFRSDSRELGFNGVVRQPLSSRTLLNAGASGLIYTGRNFKVADDLLGGDYLLDWDRFAEQDLPDNAEAKINNLLVKNDVVRQGDIYGFDYDENIRRANSWVQIQTNLRNISFFGAGELTFNEFWRTGRMQNGRFPDLSLGDSERQTFTTYGAKGGMTVKINGRNYVYANGYIGNRAPLFRDVYLSPRVRSEVVSGVEPYTIRSIEGGYQLRAPYYRARVTGYVTDFINEIESFLLFQPTVGVFGNMVQTGVNRRHTGIELALEAKPVVGWTVTGAANLGRYFYTSRPKLFLTIDNLAAKVLDNETIYQENYHVPRTPQTAVSGSIKYESKQFWFAALTANWVDNLWYDFDRSRRTDEFVVAFPGQSGARDLALKQQKAPAAFTLDFFGGKSWRIKRNYFIYVNAGLNNLLNNKNIIISGRDAYRNSYRGDAQDERLYTSEVSYAPGFNYFVSVALKM